MVSSPQKAALICVMYYFPCQLLTIKRRYSWKRWVYLFMTQGAKCGSLTRLWLIWTRAWAVWRRKAAPTLSAIFSKRQISMQWMRCLPLHLEDLVNFRHRLRIVRARHLIWPVRWRQGLQVLHGLLGPLWKGCRLRLEPFLRSWKSRWCRMLPKLSAVSPKTCRKRAVTGEKSARLWERQFPRRLPWREVICLRLRRWGCGFCRHLARRSWII